MIFVESVQDDGECGHEGLDHAELKGGLFTEAQEAYCVAFSGYATCQVEVAVLDRLASDLGHDIALAAQVFVAETEEAVDDKSLEAVAYAVEVDVVVVVLEEEQA